LVNLCKHSCSEIDGPEAMVDMLVFEPFPPIIGLIELAPGPL